MTNNQLIVLSILVSLILGFLTGHFHIGPVMSFLLWGLGAIAIGFFIEDRKEVWLNGLCFGIVLTFSFMLSVFGGTSDKLPSYLLLTLAISIAGVIGSTVTIFIGNLFKKLIK